MLQKIAKGYGIVYFSNLHPFNTKIPKNSVTKSAINFRLANPTNQPIMCDFSGGGPEGKQSAKVASELAKITDKENKVVKLLLLGYNIRFTHN